MIEMSNVSKVPPKFSSDKNYTLWKKELQAWTCITSHSKKDWGKIIALSLPESDPSDIREKAFSVDLEPTEENEKQGYDNLMNFMDDEFKKDSITDMCEHIRKFMKMEKKEEEKMKSYVSNFEAAYKVAKEKGLPELPHTYRMYQLLENANITDNEYMMVLTGITSNSTDLYDDAKKSLLKLFNSARNQGTQNDSSSIKHEPNGDTFWGSRSNNGGKTPFVSKSGGHTPWRNPHSKQGYQPSRSVSKPINPTKDGKQLLCNSCGSYRHFAKVCPYRYEGPSPSKIIPSH